MTETIYKVKTTHPVKEEYCGEFKVSVHETGSGLTLKYYATGVWGCGKNYDTKHGAVRGLIEASSTKVLSITLDKEPDPVETLTPKEHKALTALVMDDEDDHEYADFVTDEGINLVQKWFTGKNS